MSKTIALLGAMDTKGPEYEFVRNYILSRGHKVFIINIGVLENPSFKVDVDAANVAEAGGSNLDDLRASKDRGVAQAAMQKGAEKLLPELYSQGKFDGVLAMGGTGGSSVACAAMRTLPLGIPKVMVSTVAGGDVSGYVGVSDIVMIPSIVDVAGVNSISAEVFTRAAGAICGMVEAEVPAMEQKPLIAATMFGNTTVAVEGAKKILENSGYEVLVFHCTGNGGRTMENLIDAGKISGVLDLTTTEWADELVGGVFSAGPARLEAAALRGIPAIVTPACLDMVNFWAPETVPEKFKDRLFYPHNPNVTLMRTNVVENTELGKRMAEKINLSTGLVTVLFPHRGFSMIDAPEKPFWWPEADMAWLTSLKSYLREDIKVIELDCNVNDPLFYETCANCLLQNLQGQ